MKKVAVVILMGLVIAGCAARQKPEKNKLIYLAPPPPKAFNLEVYPGDGYLFKLHNREYTYKSMKVYINSHKRDTKGLYSVLFHLENVQDQNKDFHETVCFGILMMDTNVAGYLEEKGGISPVRWENGQGGSLGIQMMYRQCSNQ